MVSEFANTPLIDDVGSFPLPDTARKDMFEKMYWEAYNALIKGIDVSRNRTVQRYVIQPVEKSLEEKIHSGLDIINYPQHIDMYSQFLNPIEKYQDEPFIIQSDKAKIVELEMLKDYSKRYYKENGEPLKLKACVTGAMELYAKTNGFAVYKDIAMNYAESVNRFLKNALINEKYAKMEVLSIDEPSIGLVTFNQVSDSDISDILKKSVEGLDVDVQIHLHSLNAYRLALNVDNIHILTSEYASDTKNVIPKKDLDQYDKFMRVGITRTALGTIVSEKIDQGMSSRDFESKEGMFEAIDSVDRIEQRYKEALNHYGDRLKYVGPDCGLKSWGYQDVAVELIKRTVEALKRYHNKE